MSRLGAVIAYAERIGTLELALLRLPPSAAMPALQLPELEVLVVLKGALRLRSTAQPDFIAPFALARRLDRVVQVQATAEAELLSIRMAASMLALGGDPRSPEVWALPGSATAIGGQLASMLSARRDADDLLLQGLGMSLMGWAVLSSSVSDDCSGSAWISRIIAELQSRGEMPATAELAELAGVNGAHLSRVFRAEMGMSPSVFHRQLRVQRACVLMQDSSLPIARIAALSGFADHAHFSRVFREVMGRTPSHYRSALQKQRQNGNVGGAVNPVGRYQLSSCTALGVPYDATIVITLGARGYEGWIQTSVMPDVRIDSIAILPGRLVLTTKVPAGVAILDLRFKGAEFEGEWRLAAKSTPVRGRKTTTEP